MLKQPHVSAGITAAEWTRLRDNSIISAAAGVALGSSDLRNKQHIDNILAKMSTNSNDEVGDIDMLTETCS